MSKPARLTKAGLAKACRELAAIDPDLKRILEAHGTPPLWDRRPGFATLVHIILEQQVSLASAQAAIDKLRAAISDITPQSFLTLSDDALKSIGFSYQKASYCQGLARAVEDGTFAIDHLGKVSDDEAFETLRAQRGIGPWTAGIYLLMVLCRPNIWPHGDRALAVAAREVKGLDEVPSYDALGEIAESWHPWRAAAARLLWHHYLSTPRHRKA